MPRCLFIMSIIGLIILPRNVICAIDPHYVHHECTRRDNLYTSGSIFEANLNTTLLNVLPVNASKSGYSRHDTGNGTNQLYAFSYCRGDVTGQGCHDCVEDAGRAVLQRCEHLKEGIIWYEECTLRYSNRSVIVSGEEVTPSHLKHNFSSVLNSLNREKNTFDKLMNGLIAQAAKQDDQGKLQGYATEETPLLSSSPQSLTLRGEVQCRPDTVSETCETCLRSALKQMDGWSTPLAFLPNCNLRFELFPLQITNPPSSSGGGGSLPRKVLVSVVVAVVVVIVVILSIIVCLIIRYKRKQRQGDHNTHLTDGVQPNNIVDDQREHRPDDEEHGGASVGVHHHTPADVQESIISVREKKPSQSGAYNPLQNAEQRAYYPEPSAPSFPADVKPVSVSLESGFRRQLEAEPRTQDKFQTLFKNSIMSQQWRWFCSKIMNNSLPTRKSLISPRTKTLCAFCGEDETSAHVLRDCSLARRIWRNTRLGVIINDNYIPDLNTYTLLSCWFEALFIYLHSIQDGGDLWTELVATMWAIWTHRNDVVFRGAKVDPVEIMKIAVMEKTRWTQVFKNETKINNHNNNVYNCEIDVWNWGGDSSALMLVTNCSSWRRDDNWVVMKGDTIVAKERRRVFVKDQVEVEDYALLHGLKECRVTKANYNYNYNKMQLHIWSDSSQVVNAFSNPFSIARDSDSVYIFFLSDEFVHTLQF